MAAHPLLGYPFQCGILVRISDLCLRVIAPLCIVSAFKTGQYTFFNLFPFYVISKIYINLFSLSKIFLKGGKEILSHKKRKSQN